MYDFFDLPNEKELAQVIIEASKKPKPAPTEIDTKTIFPFWNNQRTGKSANVVSDKTGAVKPKSDFRDSDVRDAWSKFLKGIKTAGTKPVTKVDGFGTVTVTSNAAKPDPKKLVGSIKALKTTTVKEMSGKTTTTTEELGVFKELAKSNAAKPNKDKLVGIVKAKADLGKIAAKPKVTDMSGATVVVKDAIPSAKKASTVVNDKTGAVKPKKMETVKPAKSK